MIVPRNRLIWMAGLTIPPLAVMAGVAPGLAWPAVAGVAVLVLAAAFDAVRAVNGLTGLQVKSNPVARLTLGRPGRVDLHFRDEAAAGYRLEAGLPLPATMEQVAGETVCFTLPPEENGVWLGFAVRAVCRGCYPVKQVFLARSSSWGLWDLRETRPLELEIKVYPDLSRERKNLAALFLRRGGPGFHSARQVGRGREFEKLREYIPGDTFNEIHWKATARRGRPITKMFQVEKTREVYAVLDASRLSGRPVTGLPAETENPGTDSLPPLPATVLEHGINTSLVLGQVCHQLGDLFGLITHRAGIRDFLRAGSGKAHLNLCRNALYTLQSEAVAPDFEELFAFIRLRLRRRALLVFLTSLDDPVLAEQFIEHIGILARHHLVLVGMPRPEGARPLFTGAGVDTAAGIYQRLAGHIRWHELQDLERVLFRRNVQFALLDSAAMCVQVVGRYVQIKQRQLL